MTRRRQRQLDLFGAGELLSGVVPAAVAPQVAQLAARLPPEIRLGGSTWSFPGWAGLVYDRRYAESRLAREGLAAYARHPLLRAVGVDRTHYARLPAADFAAYAAEVPEGFRFLVKAHEECTLAAFPDRPRYGPRRGLPNPRFLDPAYAAAEVVAPYAEGLGDKGGALLFQFAPQELGTPEQFAALLHRFLTALPRGPLYAVEVRNPSLLVPAYAQALAAAGACHCANVYPRMPPLPVQLERAGMEAAPAFVLRWLVRPGYRYAEAGPRFTPFNRMVAPDPETRRTVAHLLAGAAHRGQPALVTVNNLAEGSAPLSIVKLARELAGG